MEWIGKYKIEGQIGHGGMGVVYKALNTELGIHVAIKTINDSQLNNNELRERFQTEGRALARLRHPNIVQINDAGQESGTQFIVMEYMNGGSLDRVVLNHENISLAKRVGYVVQVCHALAFAHKKGYFHRDIKPANIMLHVDTGEEVAKLVDFGIAKLVDLSQTLTRFPMGTYYYMAPELISGNSKANERTDIWALGVTLYELVAYRRPFTAKNPEELKSQIILGDYKPITSLVPDCPQDLAAVIDMMLRKNPATRYQAAEDVLLDLEPVARNLRTDEGIILTKRAEELFDLGEVEAAKVSIEEAIRYDRSNANARAILLKVNDELRRKKLVPRLNELVSLGRECLNARKVPEAKRYAEEAVGLDSRFGPAIDLLKECESEESRLSEIQLNLENARRLILDGELTRANEYVKIVFSLDTENAEAKKLESDIKRKRSEIEGRKKLRRILLRTEDLIFQNKYDEALISLAQAPEEFAGDSDIWRLREKALAGRLEQVRQTLLSEARQFRTSREFDKALSVLKSLLDKFPQDAAAIELSGIIKQEIEQDRRTRELTEGLQVLRSLKAEGQYDQALVHAKNLASTIGYDDELQTLISDLETQLLAARQQEQEQIATRVELLCQKGEFSSATQLLEDAAARGVLDKESAVGQALWARIQKEQKAAEAAKKERDEYLARRNLEIRSAIDRGEFKLAMRLADDLLSEFGPNQEASILKNQAMGLEAQERSERESADLLQRAEKYLASGEIAAAHSLLQKYVQSQVLSPSDPKVADLFNRTKKLVEEEKARKSRVDRDLERIRDLASKSKIADALGALRRLIDKEGDRENLGFLLTELEIRKKEIEKLERIRLAENGAIRELIRNNNASDARQVLDDVIQRGVFQESDQVVVEFRKQINAIPLKKQELPPISLAGSPKTERRPSGRRILIPLLTVLILAVSTVAIYMKRSTDHGRKAPGNPQPTSQELQLQSTSQRLRGEHKFEEALKTDQDLQKIGGFLADWARRDAQDIQAKLDQENELMKKAKSAEEEKKWPLAIQFYNQIIALDGALRETAKAALATVELKSKGAPAGQIADDEFKRGMDALKRKDYQSAQAIFRHALNTAPTDWPNRANAENYLNKSTKFLEQNELLVRANKEFSDKNYASAKEDADRAFQYKSGDVDVERQAQALLQLIQERKDQQRDFDQAQTSDSAQAMKLLQKVIDYPNGDSDLVSRAAKQIATTNSKTTTPPPVDPNSESATQIDAAIKQGNLEQAEQTLKAFPPSDSRYQQLRQSLDDAVFDEKASETNSALNSTGDPGTEPRLKSLLMFFQDASKSSNRHAGQAALYVRSIEAALKPPPSVPLPKPVESVVSKEDKDAIQSVLNRYADAINRHKASQIREVWPGISSHDWTIVEKIINGDKKITVTITAQKWESHGTGILVTCQQVYSEPNGKQQPSKSLVGFYMVKTEGSWKISDMLLSADN